MTSTFISMVPEMFVTSLVFLIILVVTAELSIWKLGGRQRDEDAEASCGFALRNREAGFRVDCGGLHGTWDTKGRLNRGVENCTPLTTTALPRNAAFYLSFSSAFIVEFMLFSLFFFFLLVCFLLHFAVNYKNWQLLDFWIIIYYIVYEHLLCLKQHHTHTHSTLHHKNDHTVEVTAISSSQFKMWVLWLKLQQLQLLLQYISLRC